MPSSRHVEDYDSDADVDRQYFASYGEDFAVHHLMLSDAPRMRFYAAAIACAGVAGNVVVDLGAGSGVLSLLALRAGAAKVCAIEASERMHATLDATLGRNLDRIAASLRVDRDVVRSRFFVHGGTGETFDTAHATGSPVIVLVSEWMGFFLLHECMLQSVVALRDRLRHETGLEVRMVPDVANIYAAPFDARRHFRSGVKPSWQFEGLDFSVLGEIDVEERFATDRNPVIQIVHADSILLPPVKCVTLDLGTVSNDDLEQLRFSAAFDFPPDFGGGETKVLNGFALWFDVLFTTGGGGCAATSGRAGGNAAQSPCRDDAAAVDAAAAAPLALRTGPMDAPTHWKQTVVMISDDGIGAADLAGDHVVANFTLQRSDRAYQIELDLS